MFCLPRVPTRNSDNESEQSHSTKHSLSTHLDVVVTINSKVMQPTRHPIKLPFKRSYTSSRNKYNKQMCKMVKWSLSLIIIKFCWGKIENIT